MIHYNTNKGATQELRNLKTRCKSHYGEGNPVPATPPPRIPLRDLLRSQTQSIFQQLPHRTQTHTSRSPETGESNNWTPSCTRSKSRRRHCVSNLIKYEHSCSFFLERLASRAGGPKRREQQEEYPHPQAPGEGGGSVLGARELRSAGSSPRPPS